MLGHPVTFEYEFNFAEAPSNLTNQRWESLFPLNGGFFQHPAVGPDPVAFSVFHQLHCLDGIRHAYWTMRNGNHSEEGNSHHAEHSADTHIRHCLEYIRQSLICSADTTIELAEKAAEGKVGVRGFGTEHICRDFHQLVEWTSHWEDPKMVW
ncbi:Tat pathway signal sequence protein [Rutstroemia sp. NJR-2017a BBW]|nr:Tat pathway signal sequence protein [Rutstroemia sp. NJR-2017a BBW]